MKKLALVLILIFISHLSGMAQSSTDLSCRISNPVNNASVAINTPVNFDIYIKNNGMTALTSNDSVVLYFVINGDTVIHSNASNTEKFRTYTNLTIGVGDSILVTYPAVFASVFSGAFLNFCVSAFPLNRVKVFTDAATGNNTSCVQLTIGNTTGIDESTAPGNYEVYPNPATEKITIRNANGHPFQAGVYSLHGVKVKESKVRDATLSIDISDLAQGSYVLKLTDLVTKGTASKVIVKLPAASE